MEGQSFCYFLLALLTTLTMNTTSHSTSTEETNIEFIKTSCNSTTYPTLCYTSLSIYASTIQKSPKLLAHTALSITLKAAKSASTAMLKLSKSNGLKPREIGAMSVCVEEISDSVADLIRSITEMKSLKERSTGFDFMISNIQTWVSAALTDDNTCTDGFAALKGKTKDEVRGKIVNVEQLTSISLALVNKYASEYI